MLGLESLSNQAAVLALTRYRGHDPWLWRYPSCRLLPRQSTNLPYTQETTLQSF